MTILTDTRPEFHPGHVLGHDDLMLLLEYLRDTDRRRLLAQGTPGILSGLSLRAETDALDQTVWIIDPGIAIDGYARLMVSFERLEIDPADLEGQPPGPVRVWIGYTESPRRAYRQGFEVCEKDAFARVDEGFDLFFGAFSDVRARRDAVTVESEELRDAREVLRALEGPTAPVICDGSVAFQDFPQPQERRRWLIPLGRVGWDGVRLQSLAAGTGQLQASLAERDVAGVITQDILAREGMVRVARRESIGPGPGETIDDVCNRRRPVVSDFDADPMQVGVLAPRDLLWIEGRTRALDDIGLWGSALCLYNEDGSERTSSGQRVPLRLRRSQSDGLTVDTQDIEVVLGEMAQSDVANRLAIGRLRPDGTLGITAALTGLGRLGLGTGDPGRYLDAANSLVIEGTGPDAGMTLQTSGAGAIHFAQSDAAGAQTRGRIRYDHGIDALSLRAGGEDWVWLDAVGRIGLGLADPGVAADGADDFVILRDGNAGLSILCGEDAADAAASGWIGRINFGRGTDGSAANVGAILYRHNSNRMQFRANGATRMTIRANGNLGIGTTSPDTRLHVAGGAPLDGHGAARGAITVGDAGDVRLKLGNTGAQVTNGASGEQMELQPLGGGLRIHGQDDPARRVAVTNTGAVGIGTDFPVARLDVRGSVRLGGAGTQFALAAPDRDMAVRGSVSSAGARTGGSGFDVAPTGVGRYAITFTRPFSEAPSVVATADETAAAADNLITVSNVSTTGFSVRIVDIGLFLTQGGVDAGPLTSESAPFHFVAIGPLADLGS